MRKLLVLVCGLLFVVGGLLVRPVFAQTPCHDDHGGHCVPLNIGCPSGETDLGQPLGCSSGYTCCVVGIVPTLTPVPAPPTGPGDCPEGKTYVAIFRTCLDFGEFAGALINWLMIIAAGLAIIKIAAGGIQYIFASGDPKNLESAHSTMTSAIVGLMLVLLAWVIMKMIGELTPESWQIRLLGG